MKNSKHKGKTIRSFADLKGAVPTSQDFSQVDPNKKPTVIFPAFGEVEIDRLVAGEEPEIFGNYMEYRVRQIGMDVLKEYIRNGGPTGLKALAAELELFENDIRGIYFIVSVSHSEAVFEKLVKSTLEMLRAGIYVSLYVFTVRESRSTDWLQSFKDEVAATSDVEAIHSAAEQLSQQPQQTARKDGQYTHTFKNQAMNTNAQTTANNDSTNANPEHVTMTDTEASTIADQVNKSVEADKAKADKPSFLDSCRVNIKNADGEVIQEMVRYEALAFMLELNFAIVIVSSLFGAALALVGGWFAAALGLAAGGLGFALVQLSLATAGLVSYITFGGAEYVAKTVSRATLFVHNGVKSAVNWVIGLFSSKEEAEPALEAAAA